MLPLLPWTLPVGFIFNWYKCIFFLLLWELKTFKICLFNVVSEFIWFSGSKIQWWTYFCFLLNRRCLTRDRTPTQKRKIIGTFAGIWLFDFTFWSTSGLFGVIRNTPRLRHPVWLKTWKISEKNRPKGANQISGHSVISIICITEGLKLYQAILNFLFIHRLIDY